MRTRSAVSIVAALVATLATTVSTGPAAGAPVEPLSSWNQAVLGLPNNGIAYDPSRDQLLVAVAATVPTLGNHLIEVDPDDGALGRSLDLGGSPSVIAVSEDASRAYIGFDRTSSIAEVDLADLSLVRRIPLGAGLNGPNYAEDLLVQAGRSDVVVVAMRDRGGSPRHTGVVAFEDGARLPDATPTHTGPNRIELGPDAATIYGFNNESDAFGLYTMTVDGQGVRRTATQGGVLRGFGVEIEYDAGRLTASNGRVVDPAAGVAAGTYERSGAFEVDAAAGWAYYLGGGSLTRHSTTTLLQDSSVPLDVAARQLVDTAGGLAAATADGVWLLGPEVDEPALVLPPGPPSALSSDPARSVALDALDLAAGPGGEQLYAVTTVGDLQPMALVELDATSGERLRHVLLGDRPNHLAVSDDGSRIFVGHEDANHVTEIDVATFTVARTVVLPSTSHGPSYAGEIEPVPGRNDRYLLELRNGGWIPEHEGIALVVDGIVAEARTPGHSGPTTLEFAGDPSRAYGYDGDSSAFSFSTMSVADTGVVRTSSVRNLLNSYGVHLEASGGTIYASDGSVIDPLTAQVVRIFPEGGLPLPVPHRGRMLYVSGQDLVEWQLEDEGFVAQRSMAFEGTARAAVLGRDVVAVVDSSGALSLVDFANDVTAPAAALVSPADGATHVRGDLVTADYSCTDEVYGSGLTTCLGEVDDGELVDTSSVGQHTFTITAIDRSGNETVVTHAYTVVAPRCAGREVTVVLALGDEPTAGGDVILGTAGADTIRAGAGDDLVCAGAGNDEIVGGGGHDRLLGAAGRDDLRGSWGIDRVEGGDGADVVDGGRAADVLRGGVGVDVLSGGPGDDVVDGGTHRDTCDGQAGSRDRSFACEIVTGFP